MSAFKVSRDISNNFENELRKVSTELSKQNIAETPQVTEVKKDEQKIMRDYADTAMWKVIEQQTAKICTQSHFAKDLITSTTQNLDPELLEMKEKIIDQLQKYRKAESELRCLETVLQEKEDQLWQTRQAWDETLSQLKDRQKVSHSEEYGSLHKKVQALASKTKLIRWLISQLATSRAPGGEHRLGALTRARRAD